MFDRHVRGRHPPDRMGQFCNGALLRVAQVDGSGFVGVDHRDESGHQVVDVAETPSLAAVSVDGQRPAGECLEYEVGDHPAVLGFYPWPVGVEDPDDAGICTVGTGVGGGQSALSALPLQGEDGGGD
jgi:hypothetical protein